MNPTTVYHLGHARLAELHRQARRDELASAARRTRPTVLTRWIHRLGGVSVS
jgi:hypothetical protein